jgi:AraC family transcriptional regulator of adaptative response/methylated-DNA-[protein]-cysteine methyltransferase
MVHVNSNLQFAQAGGAGSAQAAVIEPEAAWQQVLSRDSAASIFYAVTTTGVFCRPSCASRRPSRENVRFFRSAEEARAAGFRPCKRCKPDAPAAKGPFHKIRSYIEANLDRRVPLAELGRVAGLSPFTVQRLFKQGLGVSPLQYQRALRAGSLRSALKQGGRGEQISYTAAQSPFGWLVVGATKRGLCWLALAGSTDEAENSLREEFPAATLHCDPSLSTLVDAAVQQVIGSATATATRNEAQAETAVEVPLDLRGTAFQLRVWQAIRAIPRGETKSYSQLARELGDPKATRAVARACATNRVALVVPCHRVVGVSGALTGYRWGVDRKRQLLAAEGAPATAPKASKS